MKKFIERLQELKGDLSVTAFAKLAGISQQSMDRYFKGRLPSIDVLDSLCTTFGVSADWLLGRTDDRGGVSPSEASELVTQIKSLESRVRSLESSTGFSRCG